MLARAAPVRYPIAVSPIDMFLGAIPGLPGAATDLADVRNALFAHGRLQVVGYSVGSAGSGCQWVATAS